MRYFKFLLFLLISAIYLIVPQNINAQIPPILATPIPCNVDPPKNPEFHSLRPYQASPCGDSSNALMCGDTLGFSDKVSIPITAANCKTNITNNQSGIPIHYSYVCENLEIPKDKDIAVQLSNASFPIEGNTELVKNSQTNTETLDDAQKVNEYLSWYLNGTIYKAEYGAPDPAKIADYAGPIRKLLPQSFVHQAQINSIEEGTQAPLNNHNQIVVCAEHQFLWFFGKSIPKECYGGNNTPASDSYRLKDWSEGNLSILRTRWNNVFNALQFIANVFHVPFDQAAYKAWNKKTPPLPWSDENGKPFETNGLYLKAYYEWRGSGCIYIPKQISILGHDIAKLPIGDFPICIDDPRVTNTYADLFPYVPLASTADKEGEVNVDSVGVSGDKMTFDISKQTFEVTDPAKLYVAHASEVNDLSILLKSIITPDKNTEPKYQPSALSGLIEQNDCNLTKVRNNPGDNLFPGELKLTVHYVLTGITCESTGPLTNCDGVVGISTKLDVATPFAGTSFSNLVAGSDSVFKRIFPKIEEGAPVSCIADIPGVSPVTYSGDVNQTGQLNFAHVGSMYEYFLKGIQTALRPQGYGEPIVSGDKSKCIEMTATECNQNVSDSMVGSKYLGSFKANFISLADRWSAKCPGPDKNMAEECYNYVASEAKKAGVNPAFALTIWLNESGASNYCAGGATTQDFGINLPALYQNIAGQLKSFLLMAKMKLCSGTAGFVEPMHGWLSRFQSSAGVCNPSDSVATNYYFDVMNTTWNWVTGCNKNGKFGITWPTDMSCP